MSQPHVERPVALMRSYVHCIRVLKDDRDKLNRAITLLENRLREHEREHGLDSTNDELSPDHANQQKAQEPDPFAGLPTRLHPTSNK